MRPKWKVRENGTIEVEGLEPLTCEAIGGEFKEGKCIIKPEKEKENGER